MSRIIESEVKCACCGEEVSIDRILSYSYENNGLSGNAMNIAKLLNMRNYYFVPFKQDNPITKPRSVVFDSEYIIPTLELALEGKQIQPILMQL